MKAFSRTTLYTAKTSSILVCFFVAIGRYVGAQKQTSLGFEFVIDSLCLLLMPAIIAWYCSKVWPECIDPWVEKSSNSIRQWLDGISIKEKHTAIIVTAGLSLFLELMLIRWQAGLFPVFMLHKNFTLLACFCGLGLGYAMSRETPLMLPLSLPLLALTLLLLMLMRFGTESNILYMLQAVPVQESATLIVFHSKAANFMSNPLFYLPVALLLTMTFALNALVMLPIGQFCGYLMERGGKPLVTYGYNLLGSIVGVVLLFILSWLWIGPVIWFGLSVALLLYYQLASPEARRIGLYSAALSVIIAAWPVTPMVQTIYSPYQIIEKVSDTTGLMRFLAAGSYIQQIENFTNEKDPWNKKVVGFLTMPFRFAPKAEHVLITGSGVGNDVEGALEAGVKSLDAVEIDPAIVELGKLDHPQHPYSDPKVHVEVNDARSFFKNNHTMYDVVVFGGQDTRILLSHGSNVRLDTFVYTEQGLREAFSHLKPHGIMSLSFVLGDDTYLGNKIFYMLKNLPGASAPVSVSNSLITAFMISKDGPVNADPAFLKRYELTDVTKTYSDADAKTIDAISTDDWPFFYMKTRSFPANYFTSLVLVLGLSTLLVRKMLPGQRWNASLLPFFFLGAGFMLVETKAITELGLVFGNTWQVVGITIIGVLLMAFCANIWVSHHERIPLPAAFACLLSVIAAGYFVATNGGIGYFGLLSKLMAVVLLTSPLFFSGIVFSTLFKNTDDIASAMAYNLMGAMLGGLFEYNSLRFGFAFLYLIAIAFYGLAWMCSRRLKLT